IVPYTRGREKSRPVSEIIKEVSELIKSGKKQVILLGQNVNSYEFGFAELLKKINDLPGDFEISFMSNHPKDMKADVIDAIATLPKVNKEIHLPLQAGSDKILKAMNRPYNSSQYLQLVKDLRFKIKDLKLTTDIIVGFPGETEEDFQRTVEVCKKVGYSLAYINKYSPRKGTAAFKLGDPIPWSEKQRRWRILEEIINRK
ncbi:MAG: radical SAM protein, partial [Candidatus Berkelbacteria bacterium]